MKAKLIKTHEWEHVENVSYGDDLLVKAFRCRHCGAEKRVGHIKSIGSFINYYAHSWSALEAVRRKPMSCNHREPV